VSIDPGHTGQRLLQIRAEGRGALAGFLHVGYPTVDISLRAIKALTGEGESEGVDLVEVGMPYSDPVMDGVTIQRAGTKALDRGVRTRDAFAAVEAVASRDTPAVVMTYWNLIERYGPTGLHVILPRLEAQVRSRRTSPRTRRGSGSRSPTITSWTESSSSPHPRPTSVSARPWRPAGDGSMPPR
jgi:hypothetical protein